MTVKELIEKLKKMPQDKIIYFYDEDGEPYTINEVFIDKDGDTALKF